MGKEIFRIFLVRTTLRPDFRAIFKSMALTFAPFLAPTHPLLGAETPPKPFFHIFSPHHLNLAKRRPRSRKMTCRAL